MSDVWAVGEGAPPHPAQTSDVRHQTSIRIRAGAIAFVLLLVLYLLTLAPDVTWWDAGEFIAAAHSLGIPHPPGVPLYILLAKVSATLFPFLGPAASVNIFSAICTAVACAIAASLIAGKTGSVMCGVGAAVCAGSMSTVWLNATETEVYAPALLLVALMLWSAVKAGESGESRWTLVTVYFFALAAPLHLTALIAAPAAILLACSRDGAPFDLSRAALLAGALLLSAGVGKASPIIAVCGLLALVCHVAVDLARKGRHGRPARVPAGVATLCITVLGVSPVLFLLLRAGWDPPVNQGNPETFQAMFDVLSRNQYEVAGLFPRQAPLWLQFANYLQYLDWQFALGVAPTVFPSPLRTFVALVFLVLAAIGIRQIGFLSRRLQWGMFALVLSASAGVVCYLNLKAGPSIGYGIIPDGSPHEARERDYFFLISFWSIGLLAGAGAAGVAMKLRRLAAPATLAICALPLLLNFSAVSRRSEPGASLPLTFATALLETLPDNAVLLTAGDNDTYPVWYLQTARGMRPDVVVITVPLIGAHWYRAEVRRRHSLMNVDTHRWMGAQEALKEVAANAAVQRRPVAASLLLTRDERELIAGGWRMAGLHYAMHNGAAIADSVPAIDREGVERASRFSPMGISARVRPAIDPVARHMAELLECPHHALALLRGNPDRAALDSTCNFR